MASIDSAPILFSLDTPHLHSPTFWLPESPLFDPTTGLIHFPDIPSRLIYTFNPASPSPATTLSVPDYIGAIFLTEDPDVFLCAAQFGIATVNKTTGDLNYIAYYYLPGKRERMRANDAAVDCKGRIWVGVMTSFGLGPPQEEGAIMVFDPETREMKIVKEPVAVPNGIVFSGDNRWCYIADTRKGVIYRYAFDAEKGELGQEEEWVKIQEEKHGKGAPDGMAVDKEGNLWVAMFNGGRVLKLHGETGEVMGRVEIQGSRQVACPRFAGRSLVITTGALVHMDAKLREECEFAGDVFVVPDVGVEGREIYKARLR
ncbi:hypothetical protein BZA77DRAFT_140642 [Pyronema omphalodes]|nr:hypothetical protein BZA77DRAFT_140642 [Pyronema omphalodes]